MPFGMAFRLFRLHLTTVPVHVHFSGQRTLGSQFLAIKSGKVEVLSDH